MKLIYLILLLNLYINLCEFSCKMCDINNKLCKICHKNYFLKNNDCIKVKNIIKNCDMYGWNGICILCKINFKLNNNKCIKIKNNIKHCNIYLNDNECKLCKDNYYYNKTIKKCLFILNQIKKCKYYSDYNICEECENGFILIKNICNPDNSNNCKKLKEIIICNKCIKNYFLNSLNVCEKIKIENCIKYKNRLCLQCDKLYFLENNKCNSINGIQIKHCKYYKTNKICSKCQLNYFLSNNKCIEDNGVKNCRLYYNNKYNICRLCKDGYKLLNNKCNFYGLIKNCIKYDGIKNLCLECRYQLSLNSNNKINYFYLNKENKCLNYNKVSNCLRYLFGKCIRCNNYFYLDNNKCITGNLKYCKKYINKDNCLECINNFYLKNGICFKNIIIENCIKYDEFNCIKCKNNYEIKSFVGYCLKVEKKINFCEEYEINNPKKCKLCFNSYLLNNKQDLCFKSNLIHNPNKCKLVYSSNICLKCDDGYYPIKQGCDLGTKSYCKKYLQDTNLLNLCKECKLGYYIINGFCYKSKLKKCLIYENGIEDKCKFFKDSYLIKYDSKEDEFICVENKDIIGCRQINDDLTKCFDCWPKFYKLYNLCVEITDCSILNKDKTKCFKCNKGFTLGYNYNKCIKSQVNFCFRLDIDNNTCIECIPKYKFINGVCKFIENCLDSKINGKCEQCTNNNENYTVLSSDYLFCKAYERINKFNCFIGYWNDGNFFCIKCINNVNVDDNGYCLNLIPNCIKNNVNNTCIKCKFGYYLKESRCHKNECEIFDKYKNFCILCKNGYSLKFNDPKKICYFGPQYGCYSHKINNECFEARPFYKKILKINKKSELKLIDNCDDKFDITNYKNSFNSKCWKCKDFYILNKNKTKCHKSDEVEHCILFDNEVCSKCEEGYNLKNNTCENINKVQNCKKYKSNKCYQCEQGFILKKIVNKFILKDVLEDVKIKNCLSYNKNSDCIWCETPYLLVYEHSRSIGGKLCILPSQAKNKYCKIYLKGNNYSKCQKCLDRYKLNEDNDCIEEVVSKSININYRVPYCIEYKNSQCIKCISDNITHNYVKYKHINVCLKSRTIENCKYHYNIEGQLICRKCNDNYYLLKNICTKINIIENCIKYDLLLDKKEAEKKEIKNCLKCSEGFYLSNGICLYNPSGIDNCLYYTKKNICIQCKHFYYLKSNACYKFKNKKQKKELCLKENLKGCEICDFAYYYNKFNKTCVLKILNCEIYNLKGNCIGCKNNTFVKNGKCFKFSDYPKYNNIKIKYCEIHNYLICYKCIEGYMLWDKKCIKSINYDTNCLKYNKGKCILCNNKYYLNQKNVCIVYNIKNNSHCDSFKQINECLNCLDGYTLYNNKCQKCYIENCNKCKNSIYECDECNDNSYMNNMGYCINLIK